MSEPGPEMLPATAEAGEAGMQLEGKWQRERVVLRNALWLFLQQGANYLLPLLTFPFLARMLGVERLGIVALGQAFAGYSIVLTEYGFSLWATREVALVRNDQVRLSALVSSVLATKLLLALAGFVLAMGVVWAVPAFRAEALFFLLSYGTVFGYAMLPDWLFQGMERMRLVTIATLSAKLIFALSIFALVRRPTDYMIVPAANALGFILAGILGVWVGLREFGIELHWPSTTSIRRCLSEARHIFYSRLSTSVYGATNTLVLGLVAGTVTVGRYAAAERITSAGIGLASPVNQAVFPFLARHHREDTQAEFRRTSRLLSIVMLLALSLLAVLVYSQAGLLVAIIFGHPDQYSTTLLRILVPTIVLGPLGAYFTQLLVIQERTRLLSRLVTAGAVLHVALVIAVVPRYGAMGLCAAVVIVQSLIVLAVAAGTRVPVSPAHGHGPGGAVPQGSS